MILDKMDSVTDTCVVDSDLTTMNIMLMSMTLIWQLNVRVPALKMLSLLKKT